MFLPMYQDIASFRWNPAEVIGMFSEALRIMDRNTTKYMIDSMHQELDDLRKEKDDLQREKDILHAKAENQSQTIADQKSQLNKYKELLLKNGIDPDSSSQTESCAAPPPVHR